MNDASKNKYNPAVVILIITGIFAVIGLIFIVSAILVSENKLKNENTTGNNPGISGYTGYTCSGPGTPFLIPPPKYIRKSPKSICPKPISTYNPQFKTKNHTVQKLYRTRTLKNIISPNHWLGNTFYGNNSYFNIYPYIGRMDNDGLFFSWPINGVLIKECNEKTCVTGSSDLFFDVSTDSSDVNPSIKIGSSSQQSLSCDILDVDALVSTVAWQYRNFNTLQIGSLNMPLAKGCPFITCEVNSLSITLDCNFSFSIETISTKLPIYLMHRGKFSDGFVIVLSRPLDISIIDRTLYIPQFTGTMRIAYFNSQSMIDILTTNSTIYPIESTISTSATGSDANITSWNIDTVFEWTTRSMNILSSHNLLMVALPHHNITNVTYESSLIDHPLIGPYRFVITDTQSWILADAVANYNFVYPSITSDSLSSVWDTEILNIVNSPPKETVNWCKWLGSIATLLLIGNMLNKNISIGLNILKNNLSLIQNNNGVLSQYNTFIYDKTWGGIIGNIGLDNCSGDGDSGNAFYQSHIGQFGYLVFSYAVAGYFDNSFLINNKQTALLFARDIANPYEFDKSFPLWRNKDWYLGYSISSGLSPQQYYGKETNNIGEIIFGYYGTYLLSTLLTDQQELMTWSLAMLASEITSLQFYFQFVSENKIDVNPSFVQGTISERGDSFYNYTVDFGNSTFPARNASIMVPIIKPLSLLSFDYISNYWAQFVQYWMTQAINSPDIEPESFGYAETLLSVNSSPETQQSIINNIVAESDIYLPYGSTWSSMLYWILSQ